MKSKLEEMPSLMWPLCGSALAIGLVVAASFCFLHENYRQIGVTLEIVALLFGMLSFRKLPYTPNLLSCLIRSDYPLATILFLLSLIVRLPYVASAPPGAFFDEAQNVAVSSSILGGWFPLFIADATQMPAGFFYLLAGYLGVTDPTIEHARQFSAILGSLSVSVFFLFLRLFFKQPIAFLSALLLLGSRWHLNFSRIAFVGISTPLLEILALGCYFISFRQRQLRWFVAAGIITALSLYTYYALNIFLPILTAAVLILYFQAPTEQRQHLRYGIFCSALAFLVFVAPLTIYAIQNPDIFFKRSATVVIWKHAAMPQALYDNLMAYVRMFHIIGDSNPRHNMHDAPMLSPIEGFLFSLGIIVAVLRWRPFGAIALLWFLIMLVPGIITIEAPQAYRTVGAIPALYLIMAFAIMQIYKLFEVMNLQRISFLCLGAMVALSARQGLDIYFNKQVADVSAWIAFDGDSRAVGELIHSVSSNTTLRVNPPFLGPVFEHFSGRSSERARFLVKEEFSSENRSRCDTPYIFVLDEFQSVLLDSIREQEPLARASVMPRPDGSMSYMAVNVAKRSCDWNFKYGFRTRMFAGEEALGNPEIDRVDLAIAYHFHDHREALPKPFTVEWSGNLKFPESGEYLFEIFSSGPAELSINGQVILNKTASSDAFIHIVSYIPSSKSACLVLRYTENSYQAKVRLRWQAPGKPWSMIPAKLVTAALCENK